MDKITLFDTFLPAVVKIAEKAGDAILKVYAQEDFQIRYKEGNSPLTVADINSHCIIVKELRLFDPTSHVLSEESKEVPFTERKSWYSYWLVDPLDGTKEFIKRSGEFTVNIALIEDGQPILGVVYAPVNQLMYSAARNAGAFKQEKGQNPYKIKVDSHKNRKLKIVASRSHAREELERFLNRIDNYEIIDMGSSLKLCLVADGSAHLYPRFGPTMEWDTAAAHCIVNEAGGNVTDIQGNPLRYNKPDLVNPDFIVSGDPGLFWRKYFL